MAPVLAMMEVVVVFRDGGEEASGVTVDVSTNEGFIVLSLVVLRLAVPLA